MTDQWAELNAAAGQNIGLGQYSEAVTALRQMTGIRPEHADSWFNLGYVLRQTRIYPDALEAYAEALRRGVAGPEAVHVNRAAMLSEYLGQLEEAERELRAAIGKNPSFLPAWLNLGGLMEDIGDADRAADAYRRALSLAPGNGRARARLSAINVHKGDVQAALRDLESQLRLGADSQDDMAELLFAFGNTLDAAGRFPEAFAAIAQANQINHAIRPSRQRYNPRDQEQVVDALIASFPAQSDQIADRRDDRVIFICGMFRSGSTVIEQLIGRHPLVQIGGELELIPALVHEHLLPYPATLRAMGAATIQRLREQYLRSIDSSFPDARHVTDKRPDNFLHIGLIKTLFPDARIVHTVRNPLDTILSIYFMNFAAAINYSDQLGDILHYVIQYRRLMEHWQTIYGADIVTIDYDELVQSPEATIAKAIDALGFPAHAAVTGPSGSGTVIRTPSNWKARSKLHSQSSGRWKNYSAELAPVRSALDGKVG